MKNFQDFKTDASFHTERYDQGLKEELLILPLLRTFFCDESIDLFQEGFTFDFYGKSKVIEFKARTNGSRDYYDTAIGANKIRSAAKLHEKNLNVFFVFKFTDGVFYWKYDPMTTLRQFPINKIDHYFIPRTLLTSIDETVL